VKEKKINYLLFSILLMSIGLVSCTPFESAIQTAIARTQAIESAVKQQTTEVLQAATPTPTSHIIEKTPTLQVDTFGTVINFILYNAETKTSIDPTPLLTPRPLPVMKAGSWIFKNRKANEIKVRVVEKTDKFNTILVSTAKKEYKIKASRGGIIFFFIVNPEWGEVFLFSPDVGETGSPIDCEFDMNYDFCYYPSSLIQIAVLENGAIVRLFKETEGWCADYKNVNHSRSVNEPFTVDTYKLPNGEYYTWTKENCPYSEITEI
jgi:hypothetical protein